VFVVNDEHCLATHGLASCGVKLLRVTDSIIVEHLIYVGVFDIFLPLTKANLLILSGVRLISEGTRRLLDTFEAQRLHVLIKFFLNRHVAVIGVLIITRNWRRPELLSIVGEVFPLNFEILYQIFELVGPEFDRAF